MENFLSTANFFLKSETKAFILKLYKINCENDLLFIHLTFDINIPVNYAFEATTCTAPDTFYFSIFPCVHLCSPFTKCSPWHAFAKHYPVHCAHRSFSVHLKFSPPSFIFIQNSKVKRIGL